MVKDAHALDDMETRGEVRRIDNLANISLMKIDAGGTVVVRHTGCVSQARH